MKVFGDGSHSQDKDWKVTGWTSCLTNFKVYRLDFYWANWLSVAVMRDSIVSSTSCLNSFEIDSVISLSISFLFSWKIRIMIKFWLFLRLLQLVSSFVPTGRAVWSHNDKTGWKPLSLVLFTRWTIAMPQWKYPKSCWFVACEVFES